MPRTGTISQSETMREAVSSSGNSDVWLMFVLKIQENQHVENGRLYDWSPLVLLVLCSNISLKLGEKHALTTLLTESGQRKSFDVDRHHSTRWLTPEGCCLLEENHIESIAVECVLVQIGSYLQHAIIICHDSTHLSIAASAETSTNDERSSDVVTLPVRCVIQRAVQVLRMRCCAP